MTGASGFIGRAVVAALEGRGDEVVGFTRSARPGWVRWDPDAGEVDWEAAGRLDGIVHLAGESIAGRWTASKRKAILRSRVESTRLVRAIVERTGASTVVSGSAIGYYGDRGDEVLTEASPPGSGFLAEVVQAWEAEAASITEARVAMARTGLVLDPSGGSLPRLLTIFKLGAGGRLGSGRQWWSWITLADEVGAILHLLDETDVEGPVNLTAPHPVRNAEFTEILAAKLHRPAVLPAPAFALRAALGAEFADEVLLASQRVEPSVLQRSGYEFRHPVLDGALSAIL